MIKLTVLYGHPTDAVAFEEYYVNTHTPIALQMKGHTRVELTKFMSAPDGGKLRGTAWRNSGLQMEKSCRKL